MNIEKVFKRIILLVFVFGFILPILAGVAAGIMDPYYDEEPFGGSNRAENLLWGLLLVWVLIYPINLYLLYKFKPIGKRIYLPLIIVLQVIILGIPYEDVGPTNHFVYVLDAVYSILTGMILAMIYFSDIKKKFNK
jgi:hypothetical protein